MDLIELARRVAEIVKSSDYVIAFTGAGVSAESGVPTFRGRGGLWERFKPEELATPEAFRRNPKLVWEWYKWRMEIIYNAKPNPAHIVLAKMGEKGLLKALITQNVDGLHQRAGSKNVVELHGNIWRVKCISCNYKGRFDKPPDVVPPRCPNCGSLLRPDVVWFGEPLPKSAWEKAVVEASIADVMIVVGTSGVVMPAGMLPWVTKKKGGKVIEVNIEASAITPIADIFVKYRAGEFFSLLGKELKII